MYIEASEHGFSFIEIMVVVIILGVLAAIVGPQLLGRTEQASINAAEAQLGIFDTALGAYELDNGRFPTTEQGLEALFEEPTTPPLPRDWRGPYMQRTLPDDPWGNPYVYRSPGANNRNSYDLFSYGADGREGGDGDDADITNW